MNTKQFFAYSSEVTLVKLDMPEKMLCVAIIDRALRDYVGQRGLRGKFWGRRKDYDQLQAEHWLFRKTGAFSLPWIADQISEDPQQFVESIRTYALRLRESGADVESLW